MVVFPWFSSRSSPGIPIPRWPSRAHALRNHALWSWKAGRYGFWFRKWWSAILDMFFYVCMYVCIYIYIYKFIIYINMYIIFTYVLHIYQHIINIDKPLEFMEFMGFFFFGYPIPFLSLSFKMSCFLYQRLCLAVEPRVGVEVRVAAAHLRDFCMHNHKKQAFGGFLTWRVSLNHPF